MTQSRGKRTAAMMSGGGARREVPAALVEQAMTAAGYPAAPGVAAALVAVLERRLLEADAGPLLARDHGDELAAIHKAAASLRAALATEVGGALLEEVAGDIHQRGGFIGPRPAPVDLFRWLARLEKAEGLYFAPHAPAVGYHAAIRGVVDALRAGGLATAVHATSDLVRLLEALDAALPGSLFPPETVASGRSDYVRRAQKAAPA
jgi:hypothetical protein